MWWYYALLSAVFASITAILSKVGIKDIDTNLATAIRSIIIVVLTWLIVFYKGSLQSFSSLTKYNILFLCLSGVTTALSWIFYFKALQLGKVSQVAPVDKLSLALTVILSMLILKEVLTIKVAIGTVLIIAGTILLIL